MTNPSLSGRGKALKIATPARRIAQYSGADSCAAIG